MTAVTPGALRLDLVSPLPPARTGIADYSADLLPYLAARCDLRVVSLPGEEPSAELCARWQPVPFAELGRQTLEDGSERARLPLYQMGNNQHHLAVWEAARRVPGVVVLHDLVLHHFHLGRTVGRGDLAGYREQVRADHDALGERVALPVRWRAFGNAAQFALPLRRSLLLAACGVLVHSAWAAAELREDEPRLRVAVVPMPVPLPPPADRAAGAALRARLGIAADAPLIGSVGFQTPMKRTPAAVQVLAHPALAGAHLVVAGEVSPYLNLEGLARKLGVAARVHLLGYLPFTEMEAVIAASDLCLNLRYPSAGETSASLLRTLALGKAAVVSDYAQFRDLPDEAVLKVPVDEEDEAGALAVRVAALLAAPQRLAAVGEAARLYVARAHDPGAAATAVVAACERWVDAEPVGTPSHGEPLPTSLTWGVLAGSLALEGAEGWRAGERRTLRVRLRNASPARWLAASRGQGGLALRVEAEGEAAERLSLDWLPLPADLPPGGEHVFTLDLRRPAGALRLRFVPRLLEMGDLPRFGGPYLEADV